VATITSKLDLKLIQTKERPIKGTCEVKRKKILKENENKGHTQNGSSCAKNTKTHHEWVLLITEISNAMIVDQRRKSGKSAKGCSSLSNVSEDVDISKVGVNDKPFKVEGFI
jgi:hypothetical protein